MADSISPELQEQIRQLQSMSGQLQQVAQQRMQMEAMQQETKDALAALEELAEDATVYRNVGSLLVTQSATDAKTRLLDEQETMDIRLKRAKAQEQEMQEAAKDLQAKIQANLPQ